MGAGTTRTFRNRHFLADFYFLIFEDMQENAGPNENYDKRKFCFQIYEDQIEILNRNTQL